MLEVTFLQDFLMSHFPGLPFADSDRKQYFLAWIGK